jgi:hypothetical protein
MPPTSKPTLTVLEASPESSQPVLMHFPSGLPAASSLHNSTKEGGLKISLLQHAKRKHQHELCVEGPVMQYKGSDYGRDGSAARATGHILIGVHRRGSGTVRLLPASSVFTMQQSIKEPRVTLAPPAATERGAEDGYAQKRRLVAELGAAKAIKRQKALASAAVSADAVFNAASLGADIAGAAEAAVEEAPAELSVHELHPLHPPFDLDATTVDAAYPRAGLIPEHVWASLDHAPLKDLCKSADQRREAGASAEKWPAFILSALAEPLSSNKTVRHERLRTVLYLTHLLRFGTIRQPIKPKKRDHPLASSLEIPQASWQQLVAEYTDVDVPRDGAPPPTVGGTDGQSPQPRRKITPPMREKICMHALALALRLGKGELTCAALASGLSLTEEKCAFYLKQLGCTVNRKVAKLTLPLVFPKLSRGAPQRR